MVIDMLFVTFSCILNTTNQGDSAYSIVSVWRYYAGKQRGNL